MMRFIGCHVEVKRFTGDANGEEGMYEHTVVNIQLNRDASGAMAAFRRKNQV
jgi:hypothetical protein